RPRAVNPGVPMNKSIPLVAVDSSQINAIGHDAEISTLAIQFKGWKGEVGATYHYQNFTAEDFEAFKAAESLGRHFGKNIKPFADKYPYTKVADMPSAEDVARMSDDELIRLAHAHGVSFEPGSYGANLIAADAAAKNPAA